MVQVITRAGGPCLANFWLALCIPDMILFISYPLILRSIHQELMSAVSCIYKYIKYINSRRFC
jgi:hypothetical protein